MYRGRDMTNLSMISKKEWKDNELAYFHHSFQQITPYLNEEGQKIHRQIIEEIESRGGLYCIDSSCIHDKDRESL
ncbi:hypothetical protein [Priestia aryabhattai]|uniref:hypothetical protein n=1 Tax=Priestia aryabhattai TaxID=412384 RepID=UPI002E22FD77|nr:hypothetical protein [Priestia aryabhattai]